MLLVVVRRSPPWLIGVAAACVVFAACSTDETSGGSASSAGGGGVGGAAVGGGGASGGGAQVGGAGGSETVEAGTECDAGEPVTNAMGALILNATGFADGVRGGVDGCIYHVTNLGDAGPGSLRDGVSGAAPTWLVFDVTGTIQPSSPIEVGSRKTIDGRGQSISIEGAGLLMEDTPRDIIVHNLRFPNGSGDAMTIYGGVQTVWIDHCELGTWGDGQIDITEQSTDVTVSWSKFENHGKVMLIGASPSSTGDDVIRVTVHHNWFNGTDERHPRVRFGKVHVYNNHQPGGLRSDAGACALAQRLATEWRGSSRQPTELGVRSRQPLLLPSRNSRRCAAHSD